MTVISSTILFSSLISRQSRRAGSFHGGYYSSDKSLRSLLKIGEGSKGPVVRGLMLVFTTLQLPATQVQLNCQCNNVWMILFVYIIVSETHGYFNQSIHQFIYSLHFRATITVTI